MRRSLLVAFGVALGGLLALALDVGCVDEHCRGAAGSPFLLDGRYAPVTPVCDGGAPAVCYPDETVTVSGAGSSVVDRFTQSDGKVVEIQYCFNASTCPVLVGDGGVAVDGG
jgi:hypothetical protein